MPDPIREADLNEHEFELDGWARWDMPSDDYYDTEEFPESYVSKTKMNLCRHHCRTATLTLSFRRRLTTAVTFGDSFTIEFPLMDTCTMTIIGRRISTRRYQDYIP